MLEQICAYIHNYFVEDAKGFFHLENGTFTIQNGTLELPFMIYGQYYLICGSRLNDGIHQYPSQELADETFNGQIYEMRVPKALIQLAGEIDEWQQKYAEVMNSPYQSESFGGYTYTKASGSGGGDSAQNGADWRKVFASRLNQWRKIA